MSNLIKKFSILVLLLVATNVAFSQSIVKEKMPEYVVVNAAIYDACFVFTAKKSENIYNEAYEYINKILDGSIGNQKVRTPSELLNKMYEIGYEYQNSIETSFKLVFRKIK